MQEKLREKLFMLKVRKIIANELNNSYYGNAGNIKSKEFLVNEKLDLDGEIIEHELSLTKYLNTYYCLDERYYKIKSKDGISIIGYNKDYAREKAKKLVIRNK